MKQFIYIVTALLLMSCNGYLDVRPENSTTFNNFFRSGQDAEALLNSMMANLRLAEYTDMIHVAAGLKVDNITWDYRGYSITGAKELNPREYFGATWRPYYEVIHDADVMLDNAYRFPMSEEIVDIYRLQACFMKGLCYFWLARAWGEVPIVPNSESIEVKLGKSSVTEVLDEATKWALKAMDLPKFEDLKDYAGNKRTSKQYGSKGAAAALLANIYAWRAALEDKKEYWEEAEKYCTMIIENEVGAYGLAADPEDVCNRVFKGGSEESILEIYRTFTTAGEFTERAYVGEQFVGWPVRTDMFVSFSYPDVIELNKTTVNELYPEGDLRRSSYFYGIDSTEFHVKVFEYDPEVGDVVEKMKVFDNTKIEKAYVNVFRFPTYTYTKNESEKFFVGMEMYKVIWRLADIMLLRAECRCRAGLPNAMEDVITVRERAGLTGATLTDDFGGDVQLAIFRERERELLFEDPRYYDVIRNGVEYIRRELSETFSRLSDRDIQNGALYYPVGARAMNNNDLILQNIYWNTKVQ
ncbi:MAG: RagB/SusD family nutrient uptake outer membrane protein [Butyricimonas virosa]